MPDNRSCFAVGHRGAPYAFPGNTMKGFLHAAQLGCRLVECDVRLSSDGVIVLAHDDRVKDTSGKSYKIVHHSAEELSGLDLGAGEGVPALAELAEAALRENFGIMADMKTEGNGVEEQVAAQLKELPAALKVVPGAGPQSRVRFRAIAPGLPLSLSLGMGERTLVEGKGFSQILENLDTDAITWEHPLLNAERTAALQARGIAVYAWTIDTPEDMLKLMGYGIDGLITNRPDIFIGLQRA